MKTQKKIGYFVWSLLTAVVFLSASYADAWAGCVQGNCQNGRGTYVWNDGDRYVGQYRNGKRNGFGTYFFKNGDRFMGKYRDGKRNGKGVYMWASGARYEGNYTDSKRHGAGKYTSASGQTSYSMYNYGTKTRTLSASEYRNMISGGSSTRVTPRRTASTGCVQGNCQNGKGTYVWSDGDRYVGNYRNGKRNGFGTYFFKSGDRFMGQYRDGNRNGKGVYMWSSGARYEGNYVNSKRHGVGKYTNSSGHASYYLYNHGNKVRDITAAEFRRGSAGTTVARNNDLNNAPRRPVASSGCISGNCKRGDGVFVDSKGNRYEGRFANGKYQGQGKLFLKNGQIVIGEFYMSRPTGIVTRYHPNGTIEVLRYKKGQRDGVGVVYAKNGSKTYQSWKNGKLKVKNMKKFLFDMRSLGANYSPAPKPTSGYASNTVTPRTPPRGSDDIANNNVVPPKFTSDDTTPGADDDCPLGAELARRSLKTFTSDKKKGLAGLIRAQKYCPGNFFVEYSLGNAYKEYNRPDLAFKTWKKLSDKYPNDYRLISGLGQVAFLMNKLDDAKKYAKMAMNVRPGDPTGWKLYMDVLFKQAKYADAYEFARTNPSVPADYRAKSAKYVVAQQWNVFRKGDRNKALTKMLKLSKKYPNEVSFGAAKEKMFLALEDDNADIPVPTALPHVAGGGTLDFNAIDGDSEVLNIRGMKATMKPTADAYALIVGISRYQNINGPKFSEKDARQFQRMLIKTAGFRNTPGHIRLRLNSDATVGSLYADVEWLLKKAKLNPDAKIVFYFSGHGSPLMGDDRQTIKDGLLVPYDASIDLLNERTALSLAYLRGKFNKLKNKNVVTIIDACFSGSGKSASNKKLVKPKVKKGLLSSHKLFITASAADRPADEYPSGQQGAFTYFFLKALMGEGDANSDGWVDSVEAFNFAKDKLTALGMDQDPQMSAPVRVKLAKVPATPQ